MRAGLCETFRRRRLQSRVRVIGASGGVGSHAVQLARAFGADVTGVCSTSKLDLLRALGADHVIDYTAEDFADGARRYHLILDIAGSSAMPASWQQVVEWPSPSRDCGLDTCVDAR